MRPSKTRPVATGLLLAMLLLPSAPAPAAARSPSAPAAAVQDVDLSDYTRFDREDLAPRHREFLDEVTWILTDEEREIFFHLDSDAKRDRFIERFWEVRDPSPGTEENEYRDLHYERLAYANDNFGRGSPSPGWRTDRGRVWILLGRPQSMNRLPNTREAVPIEVWFYSVDPALGLPPFFYLIFFQDEGVGEYRLYSPTMDGPEELLNPSGRMTAQRGGGLTDGLAIGGGFQGDPRTRALSLLRRVDPELGSAAASLIPGEGAGLGVSPLRSEMVLSRLFDVPRRIMPRATWAYNVLTGVTESRVRFETLPLETEAVVLLDPSGAPFLHWVARTTGQELNLANYEDEYYVTFEVSAAIRDRQLRTLLPGEPRTLRADLDAERARTLREGDVQYIHREPLVARDSILDLMMENNVSREFARAEIPVDIPTPAGDGVASSRALLVIDATDLGEAYDPFGEHYPFQVGSRLLIPALDGPFPTGGELRAYQQVVPAPGRLAPLLATYRIRDAEGRERVTRSLRLSPLEAPEAPFLESFVTIDLEGLPPGEYELVADVEEDGRDADVLPFRIVDAEEWLRPFTHALRLPPPSSTSVTVARARQLRVLGQVDEAIVALQRVLARDPGAEEALELQMELLRDAGRFRELEQLLEPRLAERPNDVELLLRAAEAQARLGEHYDAIRLYERARLAGAEETPELLNALASEYYAEGELERTRELLERSLELDPEQPQMRQLLERLGEGPGGEPGG